MLKESQEKNFTYEEQKKEPERSEVVNVVESMAEVLKNVAQFEPKGKDERLQKMYLREQVSDVIKTLREGDDNDTLNLIIAFRGLEQAKNQYGTEQNNFGIDSAMNELQKKVQDIEGFNLGKVEDLDRVFEDARGNVKEAMRLKIEDLSEEQAAAEKSKFERYFSIKQEIQARQRQIFGESRSFYRGISEKVSGPLLNFLTAKGEKIDDSMRDSRVALLKYIGNYGMGNKFARAVGLGIVVAGALGYAFKGELAQAAQFDDKIPEHSGSKWVSPEELKLKDPEMYGLLEKQGFIKKAGLEFTEEDRPERYAKKESQQLSRLFEKAIHDTNAIKLLETDEYRNADTPRELKELYQNFNEKDDDSSDDLAVREKYEQFLRSYSKEEMIAKYGRQEMEKIYQEAGYVNFKSLEKYFNRDIQDGAIDSDSLKGYFQGFKNASDFYKNSLDLIEKPLEQGKMHKSFNGLVEMNRVLSNINNILVIHGQGEDKLVAAEMRKLAQENIKEFKRLEKDVAVVDLGDGKFLFSNMKDMSRMLKGIIQHEIGENNAEKMAANWVKRDEGGVNYYTNEIVRYVNEKNLKGALSEDDQRLVKILLNSNVLIKTEKGYIQNQEKPYVLFTGINAYNHENQHHEFVRNDDLMKYWIKEWNTQSIDFRNKFIKSFSYRNLSEKDMKTLTEKDFTFEEIKKNFIDNSEGKKAEPLEDHKYEFLQEFQAYSTDNLKIRIFNTDYEIE